MARPAEGRMRHDPHHALHPARLPPVRGGGQPRWSEIGEPFDEIDITGDRELESEYGDRIPVIMLDGKEHGYWRVEEERLLRDLR